MKGKKKNILGTIIMFLLVFVFSFGYAITNGDDETLHPFDVEVSVSDGVASLPFQAKELEVLEDDTYSFHLKCKPSEAGILTGCVLWNENEEILFSCTGEEMTVESTELELEKGIYTVQFYYLTNESDWNAFMESADVERIGDTEYSFVDNGEWDIHYEYGFVEVENPSVAYILGMICGIAVAFVLLSFLMWIVKKLGGKVAWRWDYKNDFYDERQMLARGQAYKVAFFTMLCYVVVVSLLNEFFAVPIFMSFAGMWIGICLSILVFAIICIWKDAYMSLYENAKGVILLFSFIGILNIICGIPMILEDKTMIENGVISVNCINLIVGILFCLILIIFVGKLIYNKRHFDEEEE